MLSQWSPSFRGTSSKRARGRGDAGDVDLYLYSYLLTYRNLTKMRNEYFLSSKGLKE